VNITERNYLCARTTFNYRWEAIPVADAWRLALRLALFMFPSFPMAGAGDGG